MSEGNKVEQITLNMEQEKYTPQAVDISTNNIATIPNQAAIMLDNANNQAGSLLVAISDMAKNPEVDITKIEKLMDLHERLMKAEAKKAYARDFVVMKEHLPRVIKTKENTHTKSRYAPLEDINLAIDPILSKYGFGTQTKVLEQTDADVTVEATLLHREGHSESNIIKMPLDNKGSSGTVNKTMPHATGSSVTYAKRVAICALLNISTGDDLDGNPNVTVSAEEQALIKRIDSCKTEVELTKLWNEVKPKKNEVGYFVDRKTLLRDEAARAAAGGNNANS
jgi:hypothetical protein